MRYPGSPIPRFSGAGSHPPESLGRLPSRSFRHPRFLLVFARNPINIISPRSGPETPRALTAGAVPVRSPTSTEAPRVRRLHHGSFSPTSSPGGNRHAGRPLPATDACFRLPGAPSAAWRPAQAPRIGGRTPGEKAVASFQGESGLRPRRRSPEKISLSEMKIAHTLTEKTRTTQESVTRRNIPSASRIISSAASTPRLHLSGIPSRPL